ncbi:uncharacterized protein BO66DRAFT_437987 [Aspergillus aculeatinus CBS 121060]|uniref:Uncharacterized protein n=1 Tax=Aspergillus aculeatinus CBS 121060 TaxID=1448322 RepID=A0ACD1HAX5_9EURO|nr:hypothetical protein BO66DRAFT_437987 [Aspergillus aculeatinus CBS 121060]RAH70707.1 hypothetical protein BO66DRAFT_437987 [Aspergillus aculeatinus CBS 121060]
MAIERLAVALPQLVVISNTNVEIPDYVTSWEPDFGTAGFNRYTRRRGNINHVHSSVSTRNQDIRKLVEEAGTVLTLVIAGSIAKAQKLQRVLGSENFTLVHSRMPDDVQMTRVVHFLRGETSTIIHGEISFIECRISPPSSLDLADARLIIFEEPPAR